MNGPDYWYSSENKHKKVRRAAANTFLSEVLDNTNNIGNTVTGLAPEARKAARDEFDRILKGTSDGGALPPGVEVICLKPDTDNRANLVVFVLAPKTATIKTASGKVKTPELWRDRWVAAWVPY